jgi:hypothetical protein
MSLTQTMPCVPEMKSLSTETIAPKSQYNVSIGYLRAFITLLVLAHHAVLAYCPFSPPVAPSLTAQPRWWQAFPVVDAQKWSGFSALVGFNDTSFMSLMFFISGLFVWDSVQRKRIGGFLGDRMLRLGLPFVAAAAIVAPLAYYPAYLQIGGHGVSNFLKQWLSLGIWPAGPAWFVWVLLAFDCIAAAFFFSKPNWADGVGCFFSTVSRRPIVFLGYLIGISAAVYIPMAMKFNPMNWTQFGPFSFQISRILHYLVYFLIGIAVGAYGNERGILSQCGKLARRWWLWAIGAVVVFAMASVVFIAAVTTKATSPSWQAIAHFFFTATCATTSLAVLAVFVRFAKKSRSIFGSLRDNAYGMYLTHYAFVSWMQYALLKAHLSGFAKGTLVFLSVVALSWITTSVLRRIPWVARVI